MTTFMEYFDQSSNNVDFNVEITSYLAPHPPVIPDSAKNDTKFYEKFYWSFSYANIGLLIGVICFILWVIGSNILIIVAVLQSQRKVMSDYYIVNLALVDILVGFLVLPFMCIVVLLGYFPFGQTVCSFWIFFDYYLIIAGAFGYTGLLFCIVWMINWPDHYSSKDSKTHITIIVTLWILVNVAWGPSFIHERYQTDMDGQGICGYNIGLSSYFTLYIGIVGLYVPAAFTIGSALWCGYCMYRYQTRDRIFFGDIVPQDQRQAPMFLIKVIPVDKEVSTDYMEIATEHLPLILCMLTAFLMTRCLFYVYFGAGAFIPHFFPPDLSNGVYWMMHSNAALSPVLHFLLDSQLRHGIRKFLCTSRTVVHSNEIIL
ncbi:unnamed protein product [Allacma fusca]|uniref:G-protein coupled receptors family 1 profile domain-containing protein n=1 Tax=Allacma fusca TaxID=39272 RepID=A0A8J2LB22_9HEXA|nr:unnamed protein product [Allacma fusca]